MEVLQRTANRGSVSTGPYEIDHSLQMEDANDQNMIKNYSGDGDRRTWTYSTWVKKMKFGSASGTGQSGYDYMYLISAAYTSIYFLNNDLLRVSLYNGSSTVYADPAQRFRDGSAWYHIVVTLDSTQGTAADRVKIYINGVRVTEFDNSTYTNMSQNEEFGLGEAASNYQFGYFFAGGGNNRGFSGYVADTHYVNGTALDCTSFGEFDDDSGIWIPKEYTGSHGAKGFYFKFDDSSNLGKDSSSSGIGDFSVNANLAAINQATDTPTNNFCTINPLVTNGFALWSLTEGGTRGPNTAEGNKAVGNFGVSSGKWYWEGVTTAASGTNYWQWGITRVDMQQGLSHDPGQGSAWYSAENTFLTQTGVGASDPTYNTGITSYTVGDIWSISLNCDVNPYEMTLRFNNSVPGTSANNTDRSVGTFASAGPVMPFYFLYNIASDDTWHNFGNPFISTLSGGNSDANGYGDFKYAPPSGYYALCSKNLAEYG
tara:strand:+ start:794 stop:2248 length:1455 start_codon:yes stop_codon:yes gene_type:complete